jgi:hypothetical protein
MSLLVTEQLFPITIKYVDVPLKSGLSGVFIIDTPEKEKKYEGKVKELSTQWIRPSFKQMNDLIREASVTDPYKPDRDLDPFIYRALVLEKFLRHWDIQEDGKPVPPSPDNIGRLDPVVASALIDAFNKHNVPSEEFLKN